jgi:putative ABC transport system permease protein
VARQLLTESLAIAGAGAVLGVGFAAGGVRLAARAFPDGTPYYLRLGIDPVVLAFAAALALVTGALFGALPALRAGDVDLGEGLREGSARTGEGTRRARARTTLVVVEIALSLVLMTGAVLLLRSYHALQGVDLGFERHGVLAVRLSLPEIGYREPSARARFFQELLERLAALPGVEAVGSAEGIPFSGWDVQASVSVEGQPPRPRGQEVVSHYQFVTPGYFRAIGVPLLRGRPLTAADRSSEALVVLVNESFARTVFPGEDPLGRRVKVGGPDGSDPFATIVGVLRDFRHYDLSEPMGPAMYYPYLVAPRLSQTVVLRTSRHDPMALLPAVRAAIRGLDPDVPAYDVQTFEQVIGRSLWQQRLQGGTLGVFAGLALLLAAVGLYGVVAYTVGQRRREIGVRVALGATRGQVVGGVVGEGARLALRGVALGLLVALLVAPLLSELLYEVRPTDPWSYLGVAAVLAAVAMLASAVPALRASRVEPQTALRTD